MQTLVDWWLSLSSKDVLTGYLLIIVFLFFVVYIRELFRRKK
jgi:hypothetical protein